MLMNHPVLGGMYALLIFVMLLWMFKKMNTARGAVQKTQLHAELYLPICVGLHLMLIF